MSDLYNDFEKRFTGAWFSTGWVEVEKKDVEDTNNRKNVVKLQSELAEIEERLEDINLKKLRLSNLATMYGDLG